MKYGKAIRVARSMRGMSQKALAEATSLDPSYVSMIEKNKRVPSTQALEGIAAALGVPMYLLILMASDDADLRGISKEHADELGQHLLGMVLAAEGADE